MKLRFLVFVAALLGAAPAWADSQGASSVPGTAGNQSTAAGCIYRSGAITASNGQQMALGCDVNGNLLSTATISGGGDASAANQATQITAANLTNTDLGPLGATACATDTGSCSLNALLQRLAQRLTTLNLTLGTPAQAGAAFGLSAAATGGCTPGGYQSAASTNSTNIKASAAGTLCGGMVINTTATLYYLRLYDAAAAPTCSSATGFVATIPVPASATGAGTILDFGPFGAAFANGIGFCLTGGSSSTDNTNAATGVFLTYTFK